MSPAFTRGCDTANRFRDMVDGKQPRSMAQLNGALAGSGENDSPDGGSGRPQEIGEKPARGWSFPWEWLLLSFVVYVLSTGPVIKLVNNGVIKETMVGVVYMPLIWASHHCKPIDAFFIWYVEKLWRA